MWHALVIYPMNLHVDVATDTCLDKNHTIVSRLYLYLLCSSGLTMKSIILWF